MYLRFGRKEMYRIAVGEFIFNRLRKLHRQLKINIIKSFFCLLIYISSIGDIGNLPKIECRNDSTPPWNLVAHKLF